MYLTYAALREVTCHGPCCMVYTERAETAAVSRGTGHVTTKHRCKYTTSADTQNRAVRKVVTHLESHMRLARSESCRERGLALYKSDQQQACVSRFGLVVKLVSRRTSVRFRFGFPFSSKVVVCGHCLVTLSLAINKTVKWLSSLPILTQESFWW